MISKARHPSPGRSFQIGGVSDGLATPALLTNRSIGPSSGLDVRDHPRHRWFVGDVGVERKPTDLLRHQLGLPSRSGGNRNPHPGLGELAGDVRADPAPAAGDERDLIRELILGHGAQDRPPSMTYGSGASHS